MSSAVCFSLDQSKILPSGNGLMTFYNQQVPPLAVVEIFETSKNVSLFCDCAYKLKDHNVAYLVPKHSCLSSQF